MCSICYVAPGKSLRVSGLSCHIAKMKCLLTLSLKFFPRLKPYVWKMSVSSNECPYMLGENMYGLEMGSV